VPADYAEGHCLRLRGGARATGASAVQGREWFLKIENLKISTPLQLNYRVGIFQRTYVREIRRLTELERCIRYIEREVVDGGAADHIPPIDVSQTSVSSQREMLELETRLYDLERDIRQFLKNEAQILRNYNDLQQCKSVYEKVEAFFNVVGL